MSNTKATFEHHLIKRSLSEEDLRVSHERRRLSMEQTVTSVLTHRPQILKGYNREFEDDEKKFDVATEEQCETSEEADDDAPLDLSMGSKKRRGRTESGTDSDDSTGLGDEGRGNEGRAYKKSLMKRYCELERNQIEFLLAPKSIFDWRNKVSILTMTWFSWNEGRQKSLLRNFLLLSGSQYICLG